MSKKHKIFLILCAALVVIGMLPTQLSAQGIPKLSLTVGESDSPQDFSATMKILIGLTVLALVPTILVMVTSFVRIIVVIMMTRRAMGTPQMPPSQVLMGMALILTIFVMAPVFNQVYTDAVKPYVEGEISKEEAFKTGIEPIRQFMFKQTRERDIELFAKFAKIEKPKTRADLPTYVLIPSFLISELRTAFQISFVIFIPFLVIDMVVASVLMSMGMMMLPPIMVALPFKVLLFVMVDGWYLIIQSLVASFY
ncbi:MAG: flagellar type III secretion system pore protein FliP [candidate division Zixibacteria bacterium]|nr:flagellar type III secretion system pore protein FliP [candidate division Zixibacteria bacterium]